MFLVLLFDHVDVFTATVWNTSVPESTYKTHPNASYAVTHLPPGKQSNTILLARTFEGNFCYSFVQKGVQS